MKLFIDVSGLEYLVLPVTQETLQLLAVAKGAGHRRYTATQEYEYTNKIINAMLVQEECIKMHEQQQQDLDIS
jgi:hypothetical protein